MSRLYAGIYALFLVLFGLLCFFAYQLPYFPGDIDISLWLQGIDLPFLNPVMQAVSYIGSSIPATIIVVLLLGGLWVLGRKIELIFVASLTSVAALLGWLLKLLINRPRPNSELVLLLQENNGLSFPSGHVVYAIVLYGFLFYLVPRLVKQPVVIVVLRSGLILLVFLTGVSRVYLGAHWSSDVLGGFFLGGLLLALAVVLYHNYVKNRKY